MSFQRRYPLHYDVESGVYFVQQKNPFFRLFRGLDLMCKIQDVNSQTVVFYTSNFDIEALKARFYHENIRMKFQDFDNHFVVYERIDEETLKRIWYS